MKNSKLILRGLVAVLSLAFVFTVTPAMAQIPPFNNDCVAGDSPGNCINTTRQPPELPVEVETELAPAGSLKQAPLLKEWIQLLENPYAPVVRRPGFGVTMPELNVWPLNRTVLTNEPLRLRTSDGEISWDQPGPIFDPAQVCSLAFPCDANNVPLQVRRVIGELVVDADNNLVVRNPETNLSLDPDPDPVDTRIPPDGTVVAVPATNAAGQLVDIDGNVITALETPLNENDLLRPATDTAGVPAPLRPYIGRLGAETLGKALFWDMQVGSDGVQACGTCHFAAGADSRTKNQLSPGFLGQNFTLEVKGPNEDVVASDFPFHKLADPNITGEPLFNPENVLNDSNDVMSSMGVSRFKLFVDIPAIGAQSFGPAVNGVAPLLPDIGNDSVVEPIAAFNLTDANGNVTKLRRVEPRNTPTFHSAAFNFDNFWDGRARFEFNGGSVFGASDPFFHIFIDPGTPGNAGGPLQGATNGLIRPDMDPLDPRFNQPGRIGFSSLASQATGPPLSEFEMSFLGRNWQKIGKKLLQGDVVNTAPQSAGSQNSVVPLANQLVAIDDSRLGPFSNQGGSVCAALGRATAAGKPGLCISYGDLIRLAFMRQLWQNNGQHLNGAPGADPFDGYVLSLAGGAAASGNTNQFRQIEANMPLFFGLAVQTYEQLTIPDDSPFDRFMDANPRAAFGVGQPGEQAVLPPDQVPGLVGNLTFPDPDKFGPDELFGFDIFSGASLTAALPPCTLGTPGCRNPNLTNITGATVNVGSNPFMRTGRCMICHLGPEQTDATISIAHGTLHSDTEFEFPTPPNAPEPTGPFAFVAGFLLEDEVGETAQDAIEVEPRDMAMLDDPATPWDDRIISAQSHFGFGDQGIYNIGVRPTNEDVSRGGNDPFVQPLSRAALAMKNLAGPAFEPPDDSSDPPNVMAAFDPDLGTGGGLFEETGEGLTFPGTAYTLQSINPGLAMDPITPLMPAYMAPWLNNLPAGELHPQIDELGFAPNTISLPNGGPALEFTENLFGSDVHCGVFNPAFGLGSPNFGWGPLCPNSQTGVTNNFDPPLQGTWPFANRVTRMGAFKAAQLRNVELTGPYFHTGSMLTLRQVVDFYMRGGDFPVTNNGSRDAHIVNITAQAFGFGRTRGADLAPFADALPDTAFQYDVMPYTGAQGAATPEYATPEDAKVALVKFLISLTDERVKFERAPFDRPEIFVPVDGRAPDNDGGRAALLTNSTGVNATFRQVNATGAGGRLDANGNPDPLPNFLGINSTAGPGPDHFDR